MILETTEGYHQLKLNERFLGHIYRGLEHAVTRRNDGVQIITKEKEWDHSSVRDD